MHFAGATAIPSAVRSGIFRKFHSVASAFPFGAASAYGDTLLPLKACESSTGSILGDCSVITRHQKRAVRDLAEMRGPNFLAFAAPRVRGKVRRIPAGKRGHSLNSGGECLLDNFLYAERRWGGTIKKPPASTNNRGGQLQ